MAYGIIGFAAPGNASFPSPSIWGDCLNDELNEQAQGYYFYQNFVAGSPLPGMGNSVSDTNVTQTFSADTSLPEVMDVSVAPGTNISEIAAFGPQPVGPLSSGNKFWFEVNVAFGSVTATSSANFVGITGLANQLATAPVITGGGATNLGAVTFVGFQRVAGSNGNQLNLVQQNGTNGVVTLQANVTNSPAITANGGTAANISTNFVKLGLRYDGLQYLYSYVNGVVASKTLVDSTFDQVSVLGGTIQTWVNAATASLKVGFVREASLLSGLA